MNFTYEMLEKLLTLFKTKINENIDAIDLTEDQKLIIEKAEKMISSGDGNSYLADNGNYYEIDTESIEPLYNKIKDVVDLFNIKNVDGNMTYEINYPDSVQSKLDILSVSGDGSKVLSDNGEWVNFPENDFREMSENEVDELLSKLENI